MMNANIDMILTFIIAGQLMLFSRSKTFTQDSSTSSIAHSFPAGHGSSG
jgi:hypothetical protein